MPPDPIDAAIAAAAAGDALEAYTSVQLTLNRSSGRVVMLGVPGDMTEAEALELVGWLGNGLMAHLASVRAQPRLEVARVLPS